MVNQCFCLPLISLLAVLLGAAFYNPAEESPLRAVIQIENPEIQAKSQRIRSQVEALASGNPQVLDQFDRLSDKIQEIYSRGDGFAESDVFALFDGVQFAAEKHQDQARKNREKTPYIIHPMGVALQILEIGQIRDVDVVIGALLHDTVEDTATTFEEISSRFNTRISNFVKEVTDNKELPRAVRKELQVLNASKKSDGATIIKLSDKLYNLKDLHQESPEDWSTERVDGYFRWAKAVIDNLPSVNPPLKEAVELVIQGYWDSRKS